ncbi:MAG: hypothetical protein J6A89_06705 [Clostridia bacterium]|nr:hypothetical protein [Clostridia bacterium]
MKKFLKNIVFIVILITISLLVFNIAYNKFGYGYFSKAVSIKDNTIFSRDSKEKCSETNSYKIENKNYNNSTFYKKIKVNKNTPYKITCMIKTENVEVLDNTVNNSGAKISILNSFDQSECIIGSNDWQKVTLMFNSKQLEEIEIAFMLGGDTEKGNVKGTAWFSDLKIEEGALDSDNNWNFVCFIFKETNVKLPEGNYKYQMSEKDIEQLHNCIDRFKTTCAEFSNNLMTASCDIIEINSPITALSYDEDKGYYISPENISDEIDSYLSKKDYDHIFVCARLTDEKSSIPIKDWIGLGSMEYKGIGYSDIRMPTSSKSYEFIYNKKINQFPEEVFVHEFLHTLERNSQTYGYDVPVLHDNEKYGYKEEKSKSLYNWYKDYMSLKIQSNNKYIGLNPEIYKYKPVNESNFINSKKLTEFEEPKNVIEKTQVLIKAISSKI